MTVLGIVNSALVHRRRAVYCAVLVGAIVAAVGLMTARKYSAWGAFAPQPRSTPGGMSLSGLAAQIGVATQATEPLRTPAFYVDLLQSRWFLARVVDGPFVDGGRSGTLAEILGLKGSPAVVRDRAVSTLKKTVEADADLRTGVVRFRVRARSGDLAVQIASTLLREVNQFNVESRQSQAAAERQFAEGRLAAAQADLRAAEDELETFLQRNRDFRNSPELTFRQDRLAREVAMRQSLVTSIAVSAEQAKMDEVRDTPLIAVVETPIAPLWADSRGTVPRAVLGCVLGCLLGVLWGFWEDVWRRVTASGAPEVERLRQLLALARRDLHL